MQATALGFFRLAGWDPGSAANAFTAAAIFGGVAIAAGAGGLAIQTGGGGDSRSSGPGASGFSSADRMGGTSSFGERREKQDVQPIIVEVYMGDKSNRAAAVLMEKQLASKIRRAS